MIYDHEDSDSEIEESEDTEFSGFSSSAIRSGVRHSSPAPIVKVESVDQESDGGSEQRSFHANLSGQRDSLTSFLAASKSPSLDWADNSPPSSESSTPSSPTARRRALVPRAASVDTEFKLVPATRPAVVRRVSDAASEWNTLGMTRSLDELSNISDNEPVMALGDDDAKRESVENKQLYLMVARCIAYPFNAKHQLETSPPKLKLNIDRFRQICRVLQLCLDREQDTIRQEILLSHNETKCSRNDKFLNCLQWYIDNVMQREDVICACTKGGFSVRELDTIFKVLATKHLAYTAEDQLLDSAELQLWCSTFRKLVEQSSRSLPGTPKLSSPPSNGGVLNHDRLYRLFQNVLKIRSIEHQVLYRACQVRVCVCVCV